MQKDTLLKALLKGDVYIRQVESQSVPNLNDQVGQTVIVWH